METRSSHELITALDSLLAQAFPDSTPSERRARLLSTLLEGGEANLPAQAAASAAVNASDVCLHVTLLDRFKIEGPGGVVDEGAWTTQKSMLLFAYLATRAGRPVSDSALTGAFWPDHEEERARGSLRNAIYQVRQTVSPAAGSDLRIDRNRRSRAITLSQPIVLDVDVFERGVAEAAALFEEGLAAAALERLTSVLPVYRGELLEGFDDEWIVTRRAQLADQHLRAMHISIACRLALGDACGAEQTARYALTLDDLREELHGGLISALVQQGRRGEAVRHYLDTVAHYKREIGVTPSTLHDIYDQLLGEGPAAAPSTVQFLRHENRARTFGRRLAAASVRAVS